MIVSFIFVGEMRVFLQNLDGHLCPIDIELSDDYYSLTVKVEKETGISCEQQKIFYQTIELWAHGRTMGYYNIQEGDVMIILHRGPLERPAK